MSKFRNVTRKEWTEILNGPLKDIEGKPSEAPYSGMSAMQYIFGDELLAQAVYYRGGRIEYRVNPDLEEIING